MKKMLELPDSVFRKAKTAAAERGQTLVEYITEALRDKLAAGAGRTLAPSHPGCRDSARSSICTRKPFACKA